MTSYERHLLRIANQNQARLGTYTPSSRTYTQPAAPVHYEVRDLDPETWDRF